MLHPADALLVQNDPALPGLALLLDPDALAERLWRSFGPIEAAEARYVRYKPGENAVVALDVTAGGAVYALHAKAHRADAGRKLAKAAERTTAGSPLGPGCVLWRDASVVVSVFPNDAKLKSLRRLVDPAARQRLLARLLPDRSDLPVEAPVELRYKPERRWVGRLGDVVLKLHSAAGFPSAMGDKTPFRAGGALQTAPVLGRSARHRAIAYGWVDGRVLDAAIRDGEGDLDAVGAVGAALAVLHRQRLRSAMPRRDASEALLAATEAVAATSPPLAARVRALSERIGAALASASAPEAVVHGDFYAKQVLLSPGVPTVLDFDRLGVGAPAADLATFVAHLDRDRLRHGLSTARADAVRSALLGGYAAEAEPLAEAALSAHTAAALVGLAPHPFRFREPDWPDRTAALLDAAETYLNAARPRAVSVARHRRSALHGELAPEAECPAPEAEDPAMPALRVALDPHRAAEPLAAALGARRAVVGAVSLRRHRPGRRALVEYTVRAETQAPVRVLAKVRAKGLDRTTLRLNQTLCSNGFGPASDVAVPEPLGAWPEARAWLQRHADGETAWEPLARPGGEVVARRLARALRRLHRCGPVPARRHTLADELAHLRARVPTVARAHPALASRVAALLDACDRLAARISPSAPCPLHRDFYPDNVLVTSDRVVFLDLDLYALGDPALDAGNFVAHLVERGLRERADPDAFAAPIAAFVDAFAASGAQRVSVEAWATLSLVRHLAIGARIPSRRPLAPALLDLCERRLFGAPEALIRSWP